MGYAVGFRELNELLIKDDDKVIVLCCNDKSFKRDFDGFKIISLGIMLAERLIRYPIERRNSILIQEIDNILLNSNDKKIFIKDIDILFNPDYKIDVLRYFCGLARTKKVVVEWNGIIANGYLQYSEIGYLDYKRYSINKYDIICVK